MTSRQQNYLQQRALARTLMARAGLGWMMSNRARDRFKCLKLLPDDPRTHSDQSTAKRVTLRGLRCLKVIRCFIGAVSSHQRGHDAQRTSSRLGQHESVWDFTMPTGFLPASRQASEIKTPTRILETKVPTRGTIKRVVKSAAGKYQAKISDLTNGVQTNGDNNNKQLFHPSVVLKALN